MGNLEKEIRNDEESSAFDQTAPTEEGNQTGCGPFPDVVIQNDDESEDHYYNSSEVSDAFMLFEVFNYFFVELRMEEKTNCRRGNRRPDDLGQESGAHFCGVKK